MKTQGIKLVGMYSRDICNEKKSVKTSRHDNELRETSESSNLYKHQHFGDSLKGMLNITS